jgi:hypothetical protein
MTNADLQNISEIIRIISSIFQGQDPELKYFDNYQDATRTKSLGSMITNRKSTNSTITSSLMIPTMTQKKRMGSGKCSSSTTKATFLYLSTMLRYSSTCTTKSSASKLKPSTQNYIFSKNLKSAPFLTLSKKLKLKIAPTAPKTLSSWTIGQTKAKRTSSSTWSPTKNPSSICPCSETSFSSHPTSASRNPSKWPRISNSSRKCPSKTSSSTWSKPPTSSLTST